MLIIFERLFFTVVLIALVSVVVVQSPQWYATLLPGIQKVEVDGNFIHIDRLSIEKAINEAVTGDFFDTDLALLEEQLERRQWIKQVWIKRVWPHTLSIQIEEHQALVRWGDQALIDEEGEFFVVEDDSKPALPIIHGERGRSQFLLNQYGQMNQSLQAINLSIHLLEESVRGTLHLILSNGWHLQFGKKKWEQRLERFIRVYQSVLSQADQKLMQIHCLDFRYARGFASKQNSVECFS